MKLQSLLEMPYYIPREYKFTTEYQTRFIEQDVFDEDYKIINTSNDIVIVLHNDKSNALAVIPNVGGVTVIGGIDFLPNQGIDTDLLNLRNTLRVSTVIIAKNTVKKGIASLIYTSLVQAKYVIISDNTHFDGGKALWKRLAKHKLSDEVIYIVHRNEFLKDDSEIINYDGNNIPDEVIWGQEQYFGRPGDISHEDTYLVYGLKNEIN